MKNLTKKLNDLARITRTTLNTFLEDWRNPAGGTVLIKRDLMIYQKTLLSEDDFWTITHLGFYVNPAGNIPFANLRTYLTEIYETTETKVTRSSIIPILQTMRKLRTLAEMLEDAAKIIL